MTRRYRNRVHENMSLTAPTTAEQLSAAFAEFEDASRELSGFYQGLEQQVGMLTRELQRSREGQARELAEKERLASRLNSLLEALPGGIVVLDQHGRVQELNPVARDLLGAVEPGEAWQAVVGRAFLPRWDDGHDVSLADGRRVNIATQALAGEPGQILLLTDVTDTRRLLEQLEHHKRLSAKTEMAAALAHQIRTPLASALLTLGNIRRARDDAFRERAVSAGVASLQKLERLVNDMLLFARGRQFDVEAVTLAALFDAIREAVAAAPVSPAVRFELPDGTAALGIYANLDALASVALNLIENAVQACGNDVVIRVCAAADDAIRISFRDNGPGIAPDAQDLVFEPFHSGRTNGTGLGLPVARAVARAHGGDLVLDPQPPGACFVLTLPISAGHAERLPETARKAS